MTDFDDELVELLLIPGVGRAKAKALYDAGFKTIKDIENAKISTLARVAGIGMNQAKKIQNFAFKHELADEMKEVETSVISMCPLCGSLLAPGADNCPNCGVVFEGDEFVDDEVSAIEDPDAPYGHKDEPAQIFLCPDCGNMIPGDTEKCPHCGVFFEAEDDIDKKLAVDGELAGLEELLIEKEQEVDDHQEKAELFLCPDCGSFISVDASSCEHCGTVLEGEEEIGVTDAPSDDEINEILGMLVETEEEEEPKKDEEPVEFFLCPECGSFLSSDAEKCENCGVVFIEDEEPEIPTDGDVEELADMLIQKPEEPSPEDEGPDGHRYKDKAELFLCPNCGAFISVDASSCEHCGVLFEPEEDIPMDEEARELADMLVEKTEEDLDGHRYKDKAELFLCPECGAFISVDSSSCENCGVVFADEDEVLLDEEILELEDMLVGKSPEEVEELTDKGELFLCPNCGAFISVEATSCQHCGVIFEGEEEIGPEPEEKAITKEKTEDLDGHWYKDKAELFLCPECGAFISVEASSCENCGVIFEIGEEEPDIPLDDEVRELADMLVEKTEEELDGHWYKDKAELFLCPMCGAFISAGAGSCESCGVVFSDDEEDMVEHEVHLPPGIEEEEPDFGLKICGTCGGFISESAGECPVCGEDVSEDGTVEPPKVVIPLPGADVIEEPSEVPPVGKVTEEAVFEGILEDDMAEDISDDLIDLLDELEVDELEVDDEDIISQLMPEVPKPADSDITIDDLEFELDLSEPSDDTILEDLDLSGPPEDELILEDLDLQLDEMIVDDLLEEGIEKVEKGEVEVPKSIAKDFMKRWSKIQDEEDEEIEELELSKPDEVSEEKMDIDEELGLVDEKDSRLVFIDESILLDPDNHQLWARKAEILAELGEFDEAITCYDKAAELSFDNEDRYKRRILEILHGEKLPEAAEELESLEELELKDKVVLESENFEARIVEIDELLGYFPGQEELLMEKGDLLKKLGRQEEALECFDEVIKIKQKIIGPAVSKKYLDGEYEGSLRIGMINGDGRVNGRVNGMLTRRGRINGRINGLVNGRGRTNGRINGRINGLTSGRINGLTNGRINGLTNGRINGLTNGRVNGLTNGRVNGLVNGSGLVNGRVNGLINGSGLVNGRINGLVNGRFRHLIDSGLVNGLGLVNGDGLVNGRGRFYRPSARRYSRRHWRGRMTWMVVLISIIMLLPIFANITTISEIGSTNIDGDFNDWIDIKTHYDSPNDQLLNPDLNLLDVRVNYKTLDSDTQNLDIYLRVEGTLLGGQASNSTRGIDSIYIFVDKDEDVETGYSVSNMGADFLVDIQGWNNRISSSDIFRFDDDHDKDDWKGFTPAGNSARAIYNSQLETRLILDNVYSRDIQPRVLVVSQDAEGRTDFSDSVLTSNYGTLRVGFERDNEPDIIMPGGTDVNTIKFDSYGFDSRITSITFQHTGGADLTQVSNTRLIMDSDADGVYEPGVDSEVAGTYTEVDTRKFRFDLDDPLGIIVNQTSRMYLTYDINSPAGSGTVGVNVNNVEMEEGSILYMPVNKGVIHNIGLPSTVEIDGAFGDWQNALVNVDAANDAVQGDPNYDETIINQNVDLRDYRMFVDDDLAVYGSVAGIIMGGADVPTLRSRPVPVEDTNVSERPPIQPDSDRDGVPDIYDGPAGNEGAMASDFDNDGVDDQNESGDRDSDGVLDYDNGGQDYWLNTTIPLNFQANWSGNSVSRYIGPPKISEIKGLDYINVYVDADDNASTGSYINGAFGADFMLLIAGRHNTIYSSELFAYDETRNIPWRFLANASAALGSYRFELGVPLVFLGLSGQQDFSVFLEISDWKMSVDTSDDVLDHYAQATGTRSPAGDNVVINELAVLPNNAEWIEIVNPTPNPIDISGWRIRVANRNIYFFPAGTIIGAWGSGSEYLVVGDPNFINGWGGNTNHLRQRNQRVRLQWNSPGPGWTTVDDIRYPGGSIANGQTWSRYKNATYGMPEDTDDATTTSVDWYISNDGWIVPEGPTPGGPNDRRRPVIQVGKVGNTSVAAPNTQVRFTINYDNIGDGRARDVWVNDTLPAGMTYVSSSVPYTSVVGSTYTWYFTNVAPGTTNSFTITVLVGAAVPLGTLLTNLAEANYTDQLGRPMEYSGDTWDVLVSGPVPVITVEKAGDRTEATPGDTMTFTIYYNNTGSANAGNVWINDTLPVDMTFNSAVPPPDSILGQTQYWYFTNVPPGTNSISLTVDISGSVAIGSILTNTVTCDYTDLAGNPQTGGSDSASVTIIDPMFQILMNELSIQPNGNEWVEVVNPTGVAVDVSGWRIRRAGFAGVRYTFPAGTILGAWGSGTEFFVADLGGGNDLFNVGGTVYLEWNNPGPGWTTIDQTTYPGGIAATQTWSRFKHEDTGIPDDTDNDANDWYISNNAWIVPEGPTMGSHNDRRRPVIQVDKVGNTSVAAPNTQVRFTINYDNIGDGRARDVWINDTLPAGMTYVSSSVPYTSVVGSTYTWYFANVAPGTTNSFTITVLVGAAVPLGTVLTNLAEANYTDQLGRPMEYSSDTWDVLVSGPVPVITVQKNASSVNVIPNGGVSYTIWYNNTGTANAGNVWVNDTLPADISFYSSSPPPNSTLGQTQYWHFVNVPPGVNSIVVYGNVSGAAVVGSVLTNVVTLNYTDIPGSPLPGSTDSASVTVVDPMFQILMNEMSIRPNGNEWVEVVNPTGLAVDISGWRIRRSGGGGQVRYIFPAGTILGPWGSGAEFFVADLGGGNDLPNGGRTVFLEWNNPGPGWTTIDQTTYPGGIAATQTWSRFKHEDTGIPDDTDNDANDWYISNNGWIVPEGPTPGGHNDRKRPVMTVEKTAGPDPVEPGDTVTYTLWYNNTGDGNAKRVWLNDTLPTNVNYVSASVAPTIINGQNLSWYFNNLVHDSTYSLTVTAMVNDQAYDGELLVNQADLEYRDQLRRPMTPSSAWANVTCVRPQITVEKIANVTQAFPGDSIMFTIFYNNTGSIAAGSVWINDTLPNFITWVGSNPAPTSSSGLTYRWYFTNVAPGNYAIFINVTVNATAPGGTIINWANLNYTSQNGYPLPGSNDSASMDIVVIPEFQNISFIIIGFMGLVFSFRKKRKAVRQSQTDRAKEKESGKYE